MSGFDSLEPWEGSTPAPAPVGEAHLRRALAPSLVAAVLLLPAIAAAQGDERKPIPPALEAAIREKEREVAAARAEGIRLIEEFLASSTDPLETAEALYKLGELTWEEAKLAYLQRMGRYQAAVTACHKDRSRCPSVPRRQPSLDLSRAQGVYQRLIKDHPQFRKIDTVLYLYAFSLRDQGKLPDAVVYFQQILDRFPRSRFVADAWMAIAEHRFYDKQDYKSSLEAYEQVIKVPDSQLYDLALFKTAWCYWKLGQATRAAERFKDVLDLAKARAGKSRDQQRRAEELQGQALEYLVELFTEDETKSARDAFEFLAQIGGKEYSEKVLRRLADTVFDQTRYERAADAYQLLLSMAPMGGDAPEIQKRIVECYQLMGEIKRAVAEMRKLAEDYGPKSAWAQANADRPKTVASARAIAEELIRTLAKTLHQEAQRNEKESRVVDRERYARAAEAYEFYLKHFPDAPDAPELRYFRADVLYFKLGGWEAAGNEYLGVGKSSPVGKHHKDALLQAMSAFEKLRQPVAGSGKKREVTDSDRKFAEAADLYATLFPDDRDIITVIYKNGQFFYDYGDYDEAVKRFGLIIEKHPDDQNAGAAGERILDALNKAKDYENIETWARRLKETKAFRPRDQRERLDGLIVASVMKSGEKYAAAGRYEQAGGFFWRIPKEYPSHPLAPKALNNAGAALEKAKRQGEAVQAYKELADRYPKAPEAADALFVAARIEESIAAFDRAAGFYEAVAARYPQSPNAPDALRNAGVLRQTLGQYDKAIDHFADYARRHRARSDAKEVAFQVGLLHEERKDAKSTAAAFAEYVRLFPNDPRTLEALVREAQAHLKTGSDGKAKEALARSLTLWGKSKKEQESAYHAAQARYLQGELVSREYERIKIAGRPRQLQRVLEEKAKLLEQARTVYLDTVTYGVPEWATAALFRIGNGYEGFARAMRSAPVPKDLSKEEQQLYREELEKLVIVIEDKAIDAYKSGYAKALQLGVYNSYTQSIRAALSRLDDREFPPESEIRLGPRLGEPRTSIEMIEEVRRDL